MSTLLHLTHVSSSTSKNKNVLDVSPQSLFFTGFKEPFRFDRDKNGGGLLIYVREGVPAKLKTDFKLPSNIECGIIEISLNKKKWLLLGIYRPPSQQEEYFFNEISKALQGVSKILFDV